jgi:alpha-glucosidase
VLGNHDQRRIAARTGQAQARIAAMLLLTLRGTPTMYYGDELGLGRVSISPEAVQDPWEKNEPGLGLGRDPSRTPFQWDDSANAGFSSARPWLPLDPDYKACNVETLRNASGSILDLYRQLLELRRRHAALNSGSFRLVDVQGEALIYERTAPGERVLVCLNFSDREQALAIAELSGATILASTHMDQAATMSGTLLRPNEGLVFMLR